MSATDIKDNDETVSEETASSLEEQRLSSLEEANIDESKILDALRRDLGDWNVYWTDNNTRAKEDSQFLYKDQWSNNERSDFVRLQKTCLQSNQLHDPFRKILAEQRKNPPGIEVLSITGKATQQDINLHQDILETHLYHSNAKYSADIAFENQVSKGWGGMLVTLDYESSDSFLQKIFIKPVNDIFKCFWDPRAQNKSKEDGDFCGYTMPMTRDEFAAAYPNITLPESFNAVSEFSQSLLGIRKDAIDICEYWRKEWYTKVIYQLDNDESISEEEYKELEKDFEKTKKIVNKGMAKKIKYYGSGQVSDELTKNIMPVLPTILQSRVTQAYKIMYYRCIQNQIVDFREWPGKELPLVYCDGDSHYLEGCQQTYSFIHYARDTQKFINYVVSEVANQIKISNRTRFLVTDENVRGREEVWTNPEGSVGALLYTPDSRTQGGPIIVPPQELSQSLLMQYQRAVNDLKAIIGFYDVNLGAESNETSGIAIQNRGVQGGLSAFIYYNNLSYAYRQLARIILDLMPNIYDTPRTFTIKRENGKVETLEVNLQLADGTVKNKIQKLDMDIEVRASSSTPMQKQQILQTLLQLVQSYPPSAPLVGDIIAKNLDTSDVPTLVQRFQTLLPPNIIAQEKGQPPPPQQPNPEMIMLQMKQKDMELRQQNDQLTHKEKMIELNQAQMELDHKKRMEQMEFALESLKVELEAHATVGNLGINMRKSSTEIIKSKMDYATELLKVGHAINRDKVKNLG